MPTQYAETIRRSLTESIKVVLMQHEIYNAVVVFPVIEKNNMELFIVKFEIPGHKVLPHMEVIKDVCDKALIQLQNNEKKKKQ